MEAIQSPWRPESDWDGRGRWLDAKTPRSSTLRTDGCRSLEKGEEQAPQHPWQRGPRWPPPEQHPWWKWGCKKALGAGHWKVEGCWGRADNSRPAAPLPPKAPHPCPSRPASGGTDNRRKGSGKVMAPTSGNPKAQKKKPPPPPPLSTPEALAATRASRGRGALPRRLATSKGRQTRTSERRGGRRRIRSTPAQRARERQITGNLRGAMDLRHNLRQELGVKETRGRTRGYSQVTLLRLRNRESGMGQQALPALGPDKSGAGSSSSSLTRQGGRYRRQGRVEEGWVRRLEPIPLQHGQNARHQPKGRGRHLQLTLEQTFHPLHLGEGDGTPAARTQSTGTHQLRKRRIHRLGRCKDGVVSHGVGARMRRYDAWKRLGATSQRLRPGSYLLQYLRHARVHAEALPRGRSLRLAEPNLKLAMRSLSVKERARGRADLIYEVSQTRRSSVTGGGDNLWLTGLRLRRVMTRTRRRRAMRNPPRRGGLRGAPNGGIVCGARRAEARWAGWGAELCGARPDGAGCGALKSWAKGWKPGGGASGVLLGAPSPWNMRLSPTVSPGWGSPASGPSRGWQDDWFWLPNKHKIT